MSRNILNDHPWDESEVQYMLDRGREKDVETNRLEFPPGSEPLDDDDDGDESAVVQVHPDIFEHVNSLDADELKAELRSKSLSAKGDEIELKVRLANHLQEELEKSGSNSD